MAQFDISGHMVTISIFIIVNIAQFFYFTARTDANIEHLKEVKADKITTEVLKEQIGSVKEQIGGLEDMLKNMNKKLDDLLTNKLHPTDKEFIQRGR